MERKDADFYTQTGKCKIYKWDNKTCDKRHPKNWRHGYTCQFQTKYLYNNKKINKERTKEHREEMKQITEHITKLTSEIAVLHTEISVKINKIV